MPPDKEMVRLKAIVDSLAARAAQRKGPDGNDTRLEALIREGEASDRRMKEPREMQAETERLFQAYLRKLPKD